jgi:integrase
VKLPYARLLAVRRSAFALRPGSCCAATAHPVARRRHEPHGQPRRSAPGGWAKARKAAGLTAELHCHDLRHTGNTLASTAGASTRELMTRMGHSSSRAALIYQHMTSDRDRAVADRLGAMIRGGGGVASASHGEDAERRSRTRVARRLKRLRASPGGNPS